EPRADHCRQGPPAQAVIRRMNSSLAPPAPAGPFDSSRSGDRHPYGVVARRTIRRRLMGLLDLQLTGSIGGTHAQPRVPATGPPADEPLDPGRPGDRRREPGRLPRAVIHLQLDIADATIRRPGDARDRDGAG